MSAEQLKKAEENAAKGYADLLSFVSGKKKNHYWWSAEQARRAESIPVPIILPSFQRLDYHPNYCNIDGKILRYSEASEEKGQSGWDDAVYLGYGTYHGTKP